MRTLYANTRFEDETFIKEYDDHVSPEDVKREYLKCKKIFDLSKTRFSFLAPEPISVNNRTLKMERMNGFVDLRKYLFDNNNILMNNPIKICFLMIDLGKTLGYIHKNLFLKEKQEVNSLEGDKSKKVFLYSDFGLGNILIRNNSCFCLIDPSFNLINDKVFSYGSPYHDLAYFIFNLEYLIPLYHRPLYCYKNIKNFVENFLEGYVEETGIVINEGLLKSYENNIIKDFRKTTKGLTGIIWRIILKWKK